MPLPPQNVLSGQTPTRGLRVLLVDDNRDAADSMAELVRALGHDVRVTYCPEQSIMEAPAFDPQVAILDIGLPTMGGHQLGTHLRALLPMPLRLVALSGFGQESDRNKSFEHGFSAHLVKPAELAAICQALDRQVLT